jgi:hypothetical protein
MTKEYMKQKWADYRVKAFWDRVEKGAEAACWNWTGLLQQSHKNPTPYGVLGWKGKHSRAHRVAYALVNGDIPEGMMVLHACDNTLCCNPEHLYLGDHAQNMKDMVTRRRRKGVGVGEENGRSKLTREQAEAIRSIYAAGGVSQDAIGELYGVSQYAISQIILGKRYK